MSDETLYRLLEAQPWVRELASPQAIAQFACFMALLLERNRLHNLTAIRTPEAMAVHHFADSLAPLRMLGWFTDVRRAADIGSGAGFPVVPLAICMPQCEWVAIESIGKKAKFLSDVVKQLGLSNLRVVAERAEVLARGTERGRFEAVTARAVGGFASLCEIGVPMLARGGRLVLFKTSASEEEARRTQAILGLLGARLGEAKTYRFGGDRQERVLYVIERVGEVPSVYPRPQAKPFKQPLA